ncbi:uncharacterized protein LOC106672955 [Cimex lectularius]|uniref:Uncharacterized protein n=1 Tax=Cimex lectularius TaxID=79782 RepID=A0A8I6S795_CIMLE|nr:uncharacterized protein LOC106672955 [Cimex lectularius]
MKTAVYFIFLFFILNVENAKHQTKKIFRIVKFEECPGKRYKEKCIKLWNFTNQIVSVDKQIAGSTIELKNVPAKPQVVTTALKCESSEYESCVEIWSFKFDVCSKLQESFFYTNTAQLFKPDLKCPIKDGIYKSVNYTATPDDLYKFLRNAGFTSITDYYIGLRFLFLNEKRIHIGCMDGIGKFYDIKSKEIQKTTRT